jgi:hypothetical protein
MIRPGDKEVDLDRGDRADNAVADSVVLQLECRQPVFPVQQGQLVPFLKLNGKHVELILNVPVGAPGGGRCCEKGPFPASVLRCLRGE